MTEVRRYAAPKDFRRALTDRLRGLAGESTWSLAQLQRQFAYDRLLERLYAADDDWIVKGATALLARGLAARSTIDVDVYREEAVDVAEQRLRDAVRRDIGDWFRFEIRPADPLREGQQGTRLPVVAYVGAAPWAEFHIDLVGSDLRMTGTPEWVPPLAALAIPDVEQHGYRAYPIADHVADKVLATYERYGRQGVPSTRYKDLVDLVAIVSGARLDAAAGLKAVQAEAERRGVELPDAFDVPDRDLWAGGYAKEARDWDIAIATTLDEALAVVRPCLDRLLDGTAHGRWDPSAGAWVA